MTRPIMPPQSAAPEPQGSEWLEQVLRAGARSAGQSFDRSVDQRTDARPDPSAAGDIADDGFTARVLQRIAVGPALSAARSSLAAVAPQRALAIARERQMRRHREWRWTLAGILLGLAIVLVAVVLGQVDATLVAIADAVVAALRAASEAAANESARGAAGLAPADPSMSLLALVVAATSLAYVFLIRGAGFRSR